VAGDLVKQEGPEQIWAAPLADGSRAVIMFNRHTHASPFANDTMSFSWSDVGLSDEEDAMVRDLYARQDLGTYRGLFSAGVPLHGVLALKVTPASPKAHHIEWRPWHSKRRHVA
jgi:alpha-galactosidase